MKSKQPQKNKKAIWRPTQNKWHQMNRKQRREMTRKIQSEDLSLEVVHPDAAGIDIGNESHYVAVPPTRDSQPVRRFGCTTSELKGMAVWLRQCAIRTIALQSTGVYWIAVYDILEEAGFEVYLVNAKERRLGHKEEAEQFYRELKTQGRTVRVGMEASGHARWFERLLNELQFELWIGDAAAVRSKRVRRHKTDRQDAQLLLQLLLENRFPRIWVPDGENRDLRQLLEDAHARHEPVAWTTHPP
jgi:transposase